MLLMLVLASIQIILVELSYSRLQMDDKTLDLVPLMQLSSSSHSLEQVNLRICNGGRCVKNETSLHWFENVKLRNFLKKILVTLRKYELKLILAEKMDI